MYRVIYDPQTGNPSCIQTEDGLISIPFDPQNKYFAKFLHWNSQQETPLDWHTPITVEPAPELPMLEERISAVEEATMSLMLGF